MKGPSPTSRTLRALREQGFVVDICERFIPHINIRKDLFQAFDLVAISPDYAILGVQCGARSGHAAHRAKILANPTALLWLKCGAKIQIWSWGRVKVKRGGKAIKWEAKMEEITRERFL